MGFMFIRVLGSAIVLNGGELVGLIPVCLAERTHSSGSTNRTVLANDARA